MLKAVTGKGFGPARHRLELCFQHKQALNGAGNRFFGGDHESDEIEACFVNPSDCVEVGAMGDLRSDD